MNRIIRYLLIFALPALIAAAVYLYDPITANPPSQKLAEASSNYRVTIIRDDWGVPHIRGKRDADVAFGLAYAHAEDDFETIQETVAATRGSIAQYRGRSAAPTDYVVALMQIWPTLEAEYDSVPDDVKQLATAYAEGLNLFAANHPDMTWRGLAPFHGKDVIAGFMFKTPFFYGFDKVLGKLFSEDWQPELALSPDAENSAFTWRESTQQELGSNAMAVNANRSGEGITRLLINSHQPMTGPVAWYEAHVVSDQGWDMTGGLFPGTPLILHGFNKHLAWANTVNHIDLVDTYLLQLNPDDQSQYLLDGEWQDFEQQTVPIKVNLFGDFFFTAKRSLLISQHGPVIINGDHAVAVRYAGIGEVRQLEQYYRLNKASSFEDFTQAMQMNALPSINYVYADSQDNIAFIHNAQYPQRLSGWDWTKVLPGDRSDLIWQDYLPYSGVPKLVNPESGMLFNANNKPFVATDGEDNLRLDDFPKWMGLATDMTNRARRLVALNDGVSKIDKQTLLAQKFDHQYHPDSKYVALINKILALDLQDDSKLAQAQAHLAKWDYGSDIENQHAAIAIVSLREVLYSDSPDDHSADRLHAAFAQAVAFLIKHYGGYDIPWGEVNRLERGDLSLPVSGGPDVLRAIYSKNENAAGKPIASHGDTWMALVEWDDQGRQSADVLHQFGSATLDRNSPHYNDQAKLFVEQKWRRAILDWSELTASGFKTYEPTFQPRK